MRSLSEGHGNAVGAPFAAASILYKGLAPNISLSVDVIKINKLAVPCWPLTVARRSYA